MTSNQALIFLAIVGFFYLIPALIAFVRRHPSRWAILAVNAILGGTGFGWVLALVWALSATHIKVRIEQ